jgi:hypothetical protein
VSGTTISGTTTVGVDLTVSSQNPLVITSDGRVTVFGSGSGSVGVYGSALQPWTIYNSGTISSFASIYSLYTIHIGKGTYLLGGGTIVNGSADAPTSLIYGSEAGIWNLGSGLSSGLEKIANYGTISGGTGDGMGILLESFFSWGWAQALM